jgi:hypothetical protein
VAKTAKRMILPDQELYRKSKKCRICQTKIEGLTFAITKDILDGIGAPAICKKYADRIRLVTTNIYSHKGHCNPKAVALASYQAQARNSNVPADQVKIRALCEMEFDKTFELIALTEACYREIIGDVNRLNELLKQIDQEDLNLKADEKWKTRKSVLRVLEQKDAVLNQLTQNILQHFKTEKGVPEKQININMLQLNLGGLVDDVAEVLTKTVPSTLGHTTGSELRRTIGLALTDCIDARFKEILPAETADKQEP